MRKPTHIMGGVASGVVTSSLLLDSAPMQEASIPLGISAIMAGAFVGSVLCDIDHPNSFIGRKFPVISHLIRFAFGHRGATHTLLFALLVSVLTALPSLYFLDGIASVAMMLLSIGLFAGILSHLLLDALTVTGVPLLYPFSRKMFRIGRFRTGSTGETFVFVLLLVFTAFLAKSLMDDVFQFVLG